MERFLVLLELADMGVANDTLIINATHLETHRTASSLGPKKERVAAGSGAPKAG